MRLNLASPHVRGLSGIWPLEADGMNALTGQRGTLNGVPKIRVGGLGFGTVSGSGTTDYIITGKTDHATQRTYTCWLYWDGTDMTAAPGRIFDKRTSGAATELWFVEDQGTGSAKFTFSRYWSGGEAKWRTDSAPIVPNSWWFVAVTYDAGDTANNPVMYVNGKSVTVTQLSPPSGSLNSNTEAYVIGNRANDSARVWYGRLADVRMYDRLLAAPEVWDLYVNRWELYKPLPLMTNAGSVYWWTQPATPTSTQAPRSYDYFIHNW